MNRARRESHDRVIFVVKIPVSTRSFVQARAHAHTDVCANVSSLCTLVRRLTP